MAKILVLLALLINFSDNTNLYTKSFGNPDNQPLIFLHGGPGYNSATFEASTAQELAENGFYVIVYDRRGEGRSLNMKAKYTFEETFEDLDEIYRIHDIEKAILVGHSFGGIVATLFAEKFPEQVNSIVLMSAPLSLQETFKTILKSSKEIYLEKKDGINLKYISLLENMDSSTLEYSSYSFAHAMQNGFYSTTNPTEEAKKIYSQFQTDSLLINYASKMEYSAPWGFSQNEKYTVLNLKSNIENLLLKDLKIYGIYGKEDGLFSLQQVENIQNLIGNSNILYLENCSHNVFIDQQKQFIHAMKQWKNDF